MYNYSGSETFRFENYYEYQIPFHQNLEVNVSVAQYFESFDVNNDHQDRQSFEQWYSPSSWPSCCRSSENFDNSSSAKVKNKCQICGKQYARPSTLRTHLRTHSGERPFRCDRCSKTFTQAANLVAHGRTHSGDKPFHCRICGRRFSQSSSVTTHMRTHTGSRPYACSVCHKAFTDSSTLTKHYRVHTGDKPYKCGVCGFAFTQSGNLHRHMKVHVADISSIHK